MVKMWAVLLGAALAAPAAAPGKDARGLDIVWVDVEGGAATLVVTPAGESVLVDTGWAGERDAGRIVAAARAAGVARIDHLITTHWHRDHFGGLADLAARMPVGRYYDHGFPPGAPADIEPALKEAYLRVTGGASTVLEPGDAVPLGQAPGSPALALRMVAGDGRVAGEEKGAPQTRACTHRPPHPARPDDASDNARSLGFVLSFGSFQFLDLGDLTWNVEHKLACPRNLVGEVDVYQVSHHGLADSSQPALLQAAAPAVAVINNGARKGGSAETFARLKALAGLSDVFQVHRNVATGEADNAPPALVANDEEACQGHPVRLTVDPAARSYVVEVSSKGTRRTYAVR